MAQDCRRRTRSAEEVVEEIRLNLLECKVCFEKFSTSQWGRRPRNLPCGHAICLECVCTLSHPVLRQLECPFCRQPFDVGSTYDCRAIIDLWETLGPDTIRSDAGGQEGEPRNPGDGSGSGFLNLRSAFGGWGSLINPTGIARFEASGEILVVHGGHERLTVFSHQGEYLHSFGRYGHGRSNLCHPLDVAVCPSGEIVITDAGDRAVKVFSFRGLPQCSVLGPFELPWGVDIDCRGHVLVTDADAGRLWHVKVDFGRGLVLEKNVVVRGLKCPRSVSCCKATGRVAVVEHLKPPGSREHDGTSTSLKLYSNDFSLLTQVDTFSLTLMKSVRLDISFATFDRRGHMLVADSEQGFVWRLSNLQETPVVTPLVGEGLVRPVGIVAMGQDSLVVLDSGDHTVKIYSAKREDSTATKDLKLYEIS